MNGFIGTSLPLQSSITARDQWLSMTCPISYWTTSVFSSAWLTWFWFTNRSLLLLLLPWTTTVLRVTCFSLHGFLYSLPVTMENICCLSIVTETYLPNRCLSVDFRVRSLLRERVFGEPLASNGLPVWLHFSGFEASCHNNDDVKSKLPS
jgi:hypothetical protein